ncbi:50S ribosomal protein L29 [Candidatus Clavichlamydia salmonicola]|uniref:50S ribosomal protein L29 n=1 Tax=Candidatus Clavichlamydia salmonicola TaxID=469812 RepID=UPI00226428B6|nr:50S ribosomal protein L29 [Candidatus Clavichlamydia salmonicola]MBF5050755.1 50S ribosomal protein L29 [Candidatus Clavichlamydia salmonicola]
MKQKKNKDLRSMTVADLDAFINELKKEIFLLRNTRMTSGTQVQVHLFAQKKKDIARAMTVKRSIEAN